MTTERDWEWVIYRIGEMRAKVSPAWVYAEIWNTTNKRLMRRTYIDNAIVKWSLKGLLEDNAHYVIKSNNENKKEVVRRWRLQDILHTL